jgi:hypothetical protein
MATAPFLLVALVEMALQIKAAMPSTSTQRMRTRNTVSSELFSQPTHCASP